MATHKSAAKRSRQNTRKNKVNQIILSQIRTGFNKINGYLMDKNIDAASESLKLYNSVLSKAVKRGIIKKRNASRKLSSLSGQIKK